MRYLQCCLLLMTACLFAACSGDVQPRIWRTYISPDRSFSVSIPNGYDTNTHIYDTEFGRLPQHFVAWSFIAPYNVVTVEQIDIRRIELSYIDLPVAAKSFSAAALLDTSMNNFIRTYGRSFIRYLVPDHVVSTGNHPGRYFVAEKDAGKVDNQVFFVQKCLAGDRIYTLKVVAYKKHMDNKEIDMFFNSFRITS